jgi:hypothetical protein
MLASVKDWGGTPLSLIGRLQGAQLQDLRVVLQAPEEILEADGEKAGQAHASAGMSAAAPCTTARRCDPDQPAPGSAASHSGAPV